MTLRSKLSTDAGAVFLNSDHFAASITYTPHNELSKTIKAVIDRSPVRSVEHGGKPLPGNIVEIWIANHATDGVTSVKERHDKVSLPLREGGAAVELVVTKIIEQDAGLWRLEARA